MISLLASYPSVDAILAAYYAAGGVIETGGDAVTTEAVVNCADTPPMFFGGWSYPYDNQLPNLYKDALKMREVEAVQVPCQANGWTRLDAILLELSGFELIGAHAAEWYLRPENFAAFLTVLAVCPSGNLVFLEKYRNLDRDFRVVCLYVEDGKVCVGRRCANADDRFEAHDFFAVRRKSGT